MKLRIQHRTSYRYTRPVILQPHRLMLIPRGSSTLQVLSSSLSCTPEARLDWTEDVLGNRIATATFDSETTELVIATEVMVEQTAAPWPVFRIAPGAHAYPFSYPDGDAADLGSLLVPQHADPDGRLSGWARGFVHSDPTDTLALLKDINSSLLEAVTYTTRDEQGTRAPLETLAQASGSCRDIAALFVEAVRHLGFGARAASGYLYDPEAPSVGPGSMHAWAEVYLPGAGWIAFDPTHRRVGSANLIPTAVGRSNEQIMPVTGGYIGSGADFAEMAVSINITKAG